MNLEANQNPDGFNTNNMNDFNENESSSGAKVFMIGFFIVLVAGAFYGGYKLSQRFADSKVVEEETPNNENVEMVENVDVPQTASLIATIPVGKGEVVFKVSGKTNAVLREIFVHNPFKDYWIQVYDGYRKLSAEPQEVIRVNFVSIKYDKIRARTLEEYFGEINQEINVKENSSVEAQLDLR